MADKPKASAAARFQKRVLEGLLLVVPIWVTWLVLKFLFEVLAGLGAPIVKRAADWLAPSAPAAAKALQSGWFQGAVAVLLVVATLFFLGLLGARVLGRRLIALIEAIVDRIPLVKTVYGSVKQLVAALQKEPDDVQRVVLIDFPSPEMKTVGFVTRTFHDMDTGRPLAAVYVPTTPNPTSGYLEIVPVERITMTDWTVDEAMRFIVSGGAVAPDRIRYDQSAPPPEALTAAPGPAQGRKPGP